MSDRWLSIVGIGEDGRAGLSAAANAIIDAAELVVGGRRHLALVGATRGAQMPWRTPLDATIPEIVARRGQAVVVLVSGDPFWFGAGVTLARSIPVEEMLVVPAPSCFSLAAARLSWALQDTVTLGLNMRGLTPLLRRHLHHGRRILALALNGETPREVAELAAASGFGPSHITVMEALGGPHERLRSTTAASFDLADIDPLNVIAIDVVAGPDAVPIPYAPGLPDSYFENDGQLTKREVRAITLSSLQPGSGELLWDVGAGSGSVGIEWMLAHPANRAIAIERDSERAVRAARNAVALGVPRYDVRRGAAPEALAGLPEPDAIFIGGGSAAGRATIDAGWLALKPGGRIVVNSVTLETEATLLAAHDEHGGTLTRIGIERVGQLGNHAAWRPALPVLQWVCRKPVGDA
jgi:precorrin-6Y C5,15-methyltransferase (decarboxylating)